MWHCPVLLTLAAYLALCLAGCGGDLYRRVPVMGKVTCQGQPVVGGTVIFQPLDAPEKTGRPAGQSGGAAHGTIQEDGTFTLAAIDPKGGAGSLLGPHQVLFQLPPTTRPRLTADDKAAMTPDEIKQNEAEIATRPVYPPCPCTADISPQEVEVKVRDNNFEFTLPLR